MTTKHTKGPWHWSVNRLCGEHGQCVAFAPDESYEAQDGAERAANERLLCAAPELLAALIGVVACRDNHDYAEKEFRAARAAIQKATGEA